MNRFEFRIYDNVYKDIVDGNKRIEFRLLNEKTESIKIGDEILFKVLDSDKTILVKVINKYLYNNIDELWNSKEKNNNILNYNKGELIEVFYNIFGKEKVNNSKIVGIEFIIK